MSSRIPKKLKIDTIEEAVVEVRFRSSDLAELLIGRISDLPQIKSFKAEKLPFPIINSENGPEELRFIPTIKKLNENRSRSAMFSGNTLSYHSYAPYVGWASYSTEIKALYGELFNTVTDIEIVRVGLRYVNIVRSGNLGFESLKDLDLDINISKENIDDKFNFNFLKTHNTDHQIITRIASKEFLKGTGNREGLVAAIDIDVSTPEEKLDEGKSYEALCEWLDVARDLKNKSFFSLIPDDKLEDLVEEW